MPPKRTEDLLGPTGKDQGVDYIRQRLRKRVELERGITMRSNAVLMLMRCLDKAATYKRIAGIHADILAEINGPVWGLELEPLLIEIHGAWRYDGRPEVLKKDMERAARHYAVSFTMDTLLTECKFSTVRTREERLDDAAWYAIPKSER